MYGGIGVHWGLKRCIWGIGGVLGRHKGNKDIMEEIGFIGGGGYRGVLGRHRSALGEH